MDDTFWFKAESGKGTTWGTNFIRILPPHVNMQGCFYHSVPVHFGVGPGNQNMPCPRKGLNQDCPVCTFAFGLKNDGKDEEFKSMMPSWQAYMNVVVLNDDGTPKEDPPKIRIWSVSRKVLDMLIDELESTGDFTDLVKGYDVCVKRKGERFDTEWRIKLNPKPSAVTYLEAVEDLQDLTAISPYRDAQSMHLALTAGPAGEGGDPWKPEAPRPSEPEVKSADEAKSAGWADDPDEDGDNEGKPAPAKSREEARAALRAATGKK